MVRAIFISAWIILIKFLISTNLYATATWIVPPSPIPNYPYTISSTDVFVSISPSGKALVTWADNIGGNNGSPYYATYDGANWSIPQAIPNYSGIALFGVLSAVNASGNFIVSWTDYYFGSFSESIVFTTYDGTSWTTPQLVPNSGFTGLGFVSASAGGTAGHFMLAWENFDDGNKPYYAIYNGSSEIGNVQLVPGSSGSNTTVFTAASPLGNFMVTWLASSHPQYAIYNGTTWTTPSTAIPNSGTPDSSVFCSAGPSAHFMGNWMENGYTPHYAIYDGTTWTTPQQVPGTISGQSSFFTSSANSSGTYMTNWEGSGDLPYYAIYDGSNWTTPQSIDGISRASFSNIYSAAFPIGNFMVTWLDGTGTPYYAIYGQTVEANFTVTPPSGLPDTSFAFTSTVSGGTGVYSYAWDFGDGTGTSTAASPHYTYATQGSYTVTLTVTDGSGGTSAPQHTVSVATALLPPQNLIGKQKKDSNACATERFNSLSWDEDSGVAKYYLYRNGSLIATLEGNATSYKDHNQPKAKQTYLLVAQNAGGSEASSTITVGAR